MFWSDWEYWLLHWFMFAGVIATAGGLLWAIVWLFKHVRFV